MIDEPAKEVREHRARRLEEFKAAFLIAALREMGVAPGQNPEELKVEMHPDAVLALFENGEFDLPEAEWQEFLAELSEAEGVPLSDDDHSEGAEEARRLMAEEKRKRR